MIDRIDEQPTPLEYKFYERRSGKDRRKIHTMLDPDTDKRKGERRNKTSGKSIISYDKIKFVMRQ